ncbi:NAD(P)-dependent alcohol dehydrogenase [Paludibaculum fermentans]|uniref:NAD(P)-dependent alcohol dehydrogenase n=1 Tax=Paludibaculum fermentans TaxID=1473598 RepID=A0A7S7NPW9_PALFE|nr:NAD(P)-dependent alcohol dehydrogenase [Paludibaculum fermentans]QOY87555.1 NAD(P)-dependent alcohol dehydrogenase [Paludibaculum fermentans]
MRAAVYSRYGPPDVVRIQEVGKPIPRDNEVLVRIHATTVCAADWRLRTADPFLIRFMNGLLRPNKTKILGMEFSGTVEAVGPAVTRFAPDNQVFGGTGFQFGAHAEYVCLPEAGTLAAKPENMTMEEAAGVLFGGFTSLHFLRKANIQAGQNVLIYGASGSVGTFAVQLAVHFGARVTGVCSSSNVDMVRSLGAAAVLDYTREDFSSAGPVYDMVFDAVGYSGFERSLRALKRGGYYVRVGGSGKFLAILMGALQGIWVSATGAAKVVGGVAAGSREDQLFLKGLIEAGKLRTVIDRFYPLDEIAEAHRYVERGHKQGHVIIVMDPPR